jgi:hypothetical protein
MQQTFYKNKALSDASYVKNRTNQQEKLHQHANIGRGTILKRDMNT